MTRMDRWPVPSPGRWWVYRVYDPETRALLYVGCTCHPGRRMAQHWGRTWWWEWSPGTVRGCDFIDWQEYPTQEAALISEAEAIRDEDPRHNVIKDSPEVIKSTFRRLRRQQREVNREEQSS